MRWLRIMLFLIALVAISRVSVSFGNQSIWVAPIFSTATYVWTDTPCGTTATKTIATTPNAELDVALAPGCHVIQARAMSGNAVWNVYPPIQLTVAVPTPKKPSNFSIH